MKKLNAEENIKQKQTSDEILAGIDKEEYIGNYLDKHMKGHGLPYGFSYFNLLDKTEKKAERSWINFVNRKKKKR